MPARERVSAAAIAVAVTAMLGLALGHTAGIRARAEHALGEGMPPREAALARGFVLGEDQDIDPRTVDEFRRAGLSHLLAVSGQNVALLALLAMPLLAALGLPLRARLLWVLGLIAFYVPLAGAGPSIQRAGVMGGLTVLATLAGRRSSRLYGLALAALVTLAIDPGIAANVGWQLSFAAVLGILALAAPLAAALRRGFGLRGALGGAVAEGVAMTAAATLATAPLIAFHFGELSTVTLLANLLALPAVAPAMWLGMLATVAGQIPGFPAGALNALCAPLLAYIAEVASWCARPAWASLQVRLGLGALIGSYATIAAAAAAIAWLARNRHRRAADGPKRQARLHFSARRQAGRVAVGATAVAALALAWSAAGGGAGGAAPPAAGLRVSVLDVGQGDAILLQPAGAAPVLVDGGPPGDGLAGLLEEAGVGALGAAIVTHDQSDHAGGIAGLFGSTPIHSLLYGALDRGMLDEARAAGARAARLAAGSELRSGRLRLDVIWPPRVLLDRPQPGEDPNRLALVIVARWEGFSMLLTADAEAESTPIDPGPVDVLKVAHHGSDDAGLGALLDRTSPRLALISVGENNSYGHPTAGTLATLAAHGVPVLRTDRDGTIVLDVGRAGVTVRSG